MKVTLISNEFALNGSGVPRCSYSLYVALQRICNVDKIDISKQGIQFRFPIIDPLVRRDFYFMLHSSKVKNQNLHILHPEAFPEKCFGLPHKKIVTLHDFYPFDAQFYKNIYPETAPLFKRVFIAKIRRLILEDSKRLHRLLGKYDYILAVSEIARDQALKLLDLDKSKISILYDIVEDKFRPLNTNKSNDKVIIGYINNFSQNKMEKLKVFINTFKKLKGKEFELRLYGRNFYFNDLIKSDKRIKYCGFLPENRIVEVTNGFDAYLSTSTIEGFGLPIMQAKACKIPVLCYDGKIPHIVKRNTIVWNEENLEAILNKRPWEKLNVERAYLDVKKCRPAVIAREALKVYENVFG